MSDFPTSPIPDGFRGLPTPMELVRQVTECMEHIATLKREADVLRAQVAVLTRAAVGSQGGIAHVRSAIEQQPKERWLKQLHDMHEGLP